MQINCLYELNDKMPSCITCHHGKTSCQSSLKHERWSIYLSLSDPLWLKSTSLFLPCDEPRFLLENNTLKFPMAEDCHLYALVCLGEILMGFAAIQQSVASISHGEPLRTCGGIWFLMSKPQLEALSHFEQCMLSATGQADGAHQE